MLAQPRRFRPLLLGALLLFSLPVVAATGPDTQKERTAVRGTPLDEGVLSESPELREVRQFEEQAFPRGRDWGLPARDPDETPAPLPPGLQGRWGGSGDIPAELRSPGVTTKPVRPAPTPDSEWLRSLKLPEIPVRWEPQVLRYLDYFKSDPRGRAIMSSWIRRLGRYRAAFDPILEREGVPKDLVFLAMVESGFEPGAMSHVGAGGVWQFMPGAARAYGLEVSYWVDGRRDPERAAEAAGRYLHDLHVRFGSWHLAFAAYNAGYGAVLKSIARYNTNDFWELIKQEAGLPWESSLYVPKILAAAIIGHNLQAFGFADLAADPALAYEQVEVPMGTTLAAVARAVDSRLDVVELLNPELVRSRTPPDRNGFRVRIPVGTTALFAQAFDRARTPADRVETVVLRFGESLEDVARSRGIAVKELRRLNGLKDSSELRGGATVVVPARTAAAPADARTALPPEEEITLVAVPERTFNYEGRERVFYRTRDGDSLEEIASMFQVEEDELVEWNNLDPAARLHPKMVLQLFVQKNFDRAGVALLDPNSIRVVTLGSEEFLQLEAARRGKTRLRYTARAGDTLAKIARRYGLSPGDLARINRYSYNSELVEGQNVVVYSPTPDLPREVAAGRSVHQKRPLEPLSHPKAAPSKVVVATRPSGGKPVIAKSGPAKPGATKPTPRPGLTAVKAPVRKEATRGPVAPPRKLGPSVAKKKS